MLKRAARGLVADEILARQKQPYRAPDALSFVGGGVPEYVNEMMSDSAVRDAGVFEPAPIAQLWRKCRAQPEHGQFSNADNMALVGVLSTQLLHHQLIQNRPTGGPHVAPKTDEDRVRGLES